MVRSRVTIRDVAAHAGVSHMTVSRVINDSVQVSPDTRALVEAAILDLGYTPSAIATNMARGRSFYLACLSPNLTDYTFAAIIEGAEAESRNHGYFLFTSSAPDDAAFGTLVKQFVDRRRVEGLMVINPYDDGRVIHLPMNFPSVFVGAHARDEKFNSVALDDRGAAEQATRHLIDLLHTRIAMITGPSVEDCVQDRHRGYVKALQDANLSYDPDFVLEGEWSATSGFQAAQRLLTTPHPPTAIFAQNDRMAMGAINAAREMGLTVPDHLSVIGLDDMPLASYFALR